MGAAIFVDNLGIGPGNVLAAQKVKGKGKGSGKSWQGPSQFGFGKGNGKGFGGQGFGKGKGEGFGYQGTCFNCNQVGHKAAECTNARAAHVAEVGTEVPQVLVGSVEVGGSPSGSVWWMCCVEKEEVPNKPRPQHVKIATEVQHKFDCLTEDDDENECNDCMSWPVVGKGGKVDKGVKRGFGKREKHQKLQKV